MTTIVTIDMGGTGATSASEARSALGVSSAGDSSNAYAQANAAYNQANTARSDANTTFATVNTTFGTINTNYQAAYAQANNARSDANTTFGTINTTFGTVNTSLGTINTNYQAAYAQANTARSDANTTFATVNTTFSTLNSSFSTTNTNYQAAYAQANTARDTANNAYNNSNTKLSTSGGSISGDLSITGNLVVQGNATTINVSNLSVNDSIILLATGGTGDSTDIGFIGHIQRDSTNTHVGLIRKATENRFYLFDNYEVEPTNNVIDVAGNNFRVGNLRLGIVNANSYVTSAGMDVTGQANAAYSQANTARSDANTTFATVNTTFATINTNYQAAYAQANTAGTNALNAYGQANAAYGQANAAYAQANAAYGAANNRVLKAGDTMTGQLNISSGGLLVTGDVGFGSSPAFTSGSGLEIQRATATATLRLDSSSFATELYGYTGGTGLFQLSAGYLDLGTNNTTRLRIISDGNVGIGTTNPASKLTVVSNDFTAGEVFLAQLCPEGTDGSVAMGYFANGTTDLYGFIRSRHSVDLGLGAGSNQHVFIKQGGNVGIGITTPNTVFNIYGGTAGNKTDLFAISHPANAGAQPVLRFDTIPANNNVLGRLSVKDAGSYAGDMIFEVAATKGAASTTTTERMVIKNDGNVGIGTTSPSGKLHLYDSGNSLLYIEGGAGYEAGIWFRENGVNKWQIYKRANPDDLNFYSSDLTASVMTLAAAGGVGIGTLSPSTKLHLYESGAADVLFRLTAANGTYDPLIQFTGQGNDITAEGFEIWYDNDVGDVHLSTTYPNDAATIHFHTRTGASKSTSNERLTILGNGNVGIGTATPSQQLHITGNQRIGGYITNIRDNGSVSAPSTSDHSLGTRITLYDANATAWYAIGIESDTMWFNADTQYKWYIDAVQRMILDSSGNLTASGNITAQSDERKKKNIKTIENPLNKVLGLRGVSFTKIDDDSNNIGVIAQEVEKILPEVVMDGQDGFKSVAYGNMVGLLIEAIKEQQKQIEELKAKLSV